jgi:hypothetical protein
MSIKQSLGFVEGTALPENLPRIAFIKGALEPFSPKIGSSSVINQPQAKDYDESKPQGVLFVIYEKNGQPDDGWYFHVYDDDTVTVDYNYTYVNEHKGSREYFTERYQGDFQTLLNWLVAGCDVDYIHCYFKSE